MTRQELKLNYGIKTVETVDCGRLATVLMVDVEERAGFRMKGLES